MMQKDNAELAELFAPIVAKNVIASSEKQSASLDEITSSSTPRNDANEFDIDYITKVVSLIKERATFVADFWELSNFFFENPSEYDAKASKKNWKEGTAELMQELIAVLESIEDFSSTTVETIVKEWITGKEIGFGKVMQPFRLSLVGAMKGPHLFDIAEMIGKKATIDRIKNAISAL